MKISTAELVKAIDDLSKDVSYRYINRSTKTQIKIDEIRLPEGPIYIKRFNPSEGKTYDKAERESISTEMLARVAGYISPGRPFNIDRILGASYNTRSALEALLAHTPSFFFCYPGRIDSYSGTTKRGHKHLIWSTEKSHELGLIQEIETSIVISEIPSSNFVFDNLLVPEEVAGDAIDIDVQRMHAQIQIALILIGNNLGYRSWVAKNDQAIMYNESRLVEMDGVLQDLHSSNIISAFDSATTAAEFIDLIWLSNSRYMPAVMEIEHTTGVTSGLNRMKKLRDKMPSITTRYVIVAPEATRKLVFKEASQPQFADLEAKYMSYSSVEELLSLSTRRTLKGITIDFVDTFLEPIPMQ